MVARRSEMNFLEAMRCLMVDYSEVRCLEAVGCSAVVDSVAVDSVTLDWEEADYQEELVVKEFLEPSRVCHYYVSSRDL